MVTRLSKLLLRRRYIVNAGRQFRTAALVGLGVFIPLSILNIVLHLARLQERELIFADAPLEVMQLVVEHDRDESLLILAASVVFVVGVVVITILETHQTAGAAIGVARHITKVRDGRYGTRLKLRDSDNLKELTEPFNDMVQTLGKRCRTTAADLEGLADEAENLSEGAQLAARLRSLAEEQMGLCECGTSERLPSTPGDAAHRRLDD